MLCQALNDSPHAAMTPLIVMPETDGDARPAFDRVVAAAKQTLSRPVMVIAPDLSDANAVEDWPAVFGRLAAEHALSNRALVLGCAAGARLAQYFALEHPQSVLACAALAADSWASVEDCSRPEKISPVQWLIGCNTQAPGGSMHRAECFQVELASAGCAVDFLDWDDAGNELPGHALDNALRFFDDLALEVRRAA